ncbi:BLUF domain-containing protein [Aquimarina longa]|uniref:BLUF domain-containing protein n=1 Tax=Aquimarina longa TaxID=1080221 RepID=UPI000780C298|nr:BLUF domain-containing protein [Aquimarina longa]
MIKRIVYISKSTINFNSNELRQLATRASECNKQFDITGYLYFEKNHFLQYIEGEKDVINTLINNIKNDKRHEVLNVQENKDSSNRKFPTWHMHQLTKSSLIQINMENILMDYMTYNHTGISSESIWRMIDKLSKFRKKLSYSL